MTNYITICGYGDESTWPACTNHPNDPRTPDAPEVPEDFYNEALGDLLEDPDDIIELAADDEKAYQAASDLVFTAMVDLYNVKEDAISKLDISDNMKSVLFAAIELADRLFPIVDTKYCEQIGEKYDEYLEDCRYDI